MLTSRYELDCLYVSVDGVSDNQETVKAHGPLVKNNQDKDLFCKLYTWQLMLQYSCCSKFAKFGYIVYHIYFDILVPETLICKICCAVKHRYCNTISDLKLIILFYINYTVYMYYLVCMFSVAYLVYTMWQIQDLSKLYNGF